LPYYKKIGREQIHDVDLLHFHSEDILILEGVVALALVTTTPSAIQVYVDIDEVERRSRVIREYTLQGMDKLAASEIYEQRLADEFEVVAEWKNFTTLIYSKDGFIR